MDSTFDKNKIIESLFDSDISEILAELEDGEKESSFLENKLNISGEEIKKRLSYLIEHKFVLVKSEAGKIFYSIEGDKISKIIENNAHFDAAIDGLTKMDSYLN